MKTENSEERGQRIVKEIASQFRLGRITAALGQIALREAAAMRNNDFNDGFRKGYRAARDDHDEGRVWRVLEAEKEESGDH